LIEKTIQEAKHEGGGGDTQVAYDRGFSEGYDTAMAELK